MSRALRGRALPSLTRLRLKGQGLADEGLRLLAEAMHQRPEDVSSLAELTLEDHGGLGLEGCQALASAMRARGCRGLKQLRLVKSGICDAGLGFLAEALRGGGGVELLHLCVEDSPVGVAGLEVLAQALVSGACRNLEILEFWQPTGPSGARLPEKSALALVLAGHAPCSASLRKIYLTRMYDEDLFQLAAALSEPTAVRVQTLRLGTWGPGIEGVTAMLEALRHHGEMSLRDLGITVEADDVEAADQWLTEALDRGWYPKLESVGFQAAGIEVDPSKVQALAALRRRREAR